MGEQSLWTDAHRRVCIAKSRNENDRARMWTGLNFSSYMKPLIKKGFMRPVHDETPRILNWYTFTDEGWAEYDRRYKNKPDFFSEEFDERW